MSRRRDRIEKLRRMAEQVASPHEAQLAREELARLFGQEPDPAVGEQALRYVGHFDGVPQYWQAEPESGLAPGQLPGVIYIPKPLGVGR